MLLGIVLIAGLGYYLYTQSSGSELQTASLSSRSQIAIESNLFLRRLNELKAISLDGAIFSNPRFNALVDFSEPVNPQPVGKPNPFSTNQ